MKLKMKMKLDRRKEDRVTFILDNVTVKHTTSYIYLGSPFTEDGKISKVLKIHAM